MQPFMPEGPTVNISVTSSSQSITLGAGGSAKSVRIMNNGTATVWVNFGATGVTAALATSIPVGPGVTEVLTAPENLTATFVAAIAAGSTGSIYFTPGRYI